MVTVANRKINIEQNGGKKYQQVVPNNSPSTQGTEAGGLPGLHNETSQKTKSGMKITAIRQASYKHVQQELLIDV